MRARGYHTEPANLNFNSSLKNQAMNRRPRVPPKLPTLSDCDSCGICCLHMGYPSYVTGGPSSESPTGQEVSSEKAWIEMPSALKQELIEFIGSYSAPVDGELDGPCVWYDAERRCCKHHQHRPQVCRDFAVGGDGCLEWRHHSRLEHPGYLP